MGRYIRVILLSALIVINLAYSHSDDVEKAKDGKPHFTAPNVPTDSYLCLYFNSPNDLQTKLILSEAKKDGADESISKYDGVWSVEVPESSSLKNDFSLVLKSKARHHAIATKLNRPFKFNVPELVIQYEVRFDNGMDCGGAYIKLLSSSPNLNLSDFNDKTGYTIMFGPDKCGLDYKFHFIIRHKNPKTGLYEEKHARGMKESMENYINDKKTHLYTLVMRSDNTFEIFIDQKRVQSGSLLDNLEPPINPPAEVDDPNDKKPDDWDEREKIPDPDAKKPDDWDENEPAMIVDESATKPDGWLDDEPEFIPDPAAQQPDDWDSEMDGAWEAPSIKNPKCESAPGCGKWHKPEIPNPKYKGKWSPPFIPNPAYKGIWKPAQIPNPDYFEDKQPYKNLDPIAALGLELWTMTDEIVFDNFLITDSVAKANAFADETWGVKHYEEKLADPNAQSVVDAVRKTAKEKPWVVVVCGLLCTLPIVLCCVFCRSPSASKRTAAAASAKKTDEPTPDDEVAEIDIKEATGDDEDEDANEGGSTEDDMVQVPENAGGDADLVTKGDLESDSNEESQEAVKPSKSTVHKRRARKD